MEQDLLLEIGTEEIPARFIPGALETLKELARERFDQSRLAFREIKPVGTPRRLTLLVFGLSSAQSEIEETIIGPPWKAAFSEDGKPTKVAFGFARAKGVSVEELEPIETPKGAYLGIRRTLVGLPAAALLPELLPQLILDLPFPKFMRWGRSSIRFVRPIHWIVALLGGQVIPFSLGEIQSGNRSFGHRFMAPQSIPLQGAKTYLDQLRQAWVIADPAEREQIINSSVNSLAPQVGGKIPPDDQLTREIIFLVEYPEPVCGSFDPDFLSLPTEVLTTSLKEHQRYFPLIDGQGHLLPRFIAVNNTRVHDAPRVIKGHEKVLRARLSDARFFFQEDQKESLLEKVEALKRVIFHSRLGTSFEKVERIKTLSIILCRKIAPEKEGSVARAAFLCKADLTTLMVGEFPSLQGAMGREYALRSGEPPEVAEAIFEHYLPVSPASPLPQSTTGALVGLADRLDTLAGFFSLGQVPSGSADPYALRRQAQAVIVIIWDKGYTLSLKEIFKQALCPFQDRLKADPDAASKNLFDFFTLRLEYLLEGEGISRESIEAVLSAGWDDFCEVRQRVLALHGFQTHPDFPSLATGCKRALNILKGLSLSETGEVYPERFIEDQERQLYERVLEKETLLEGLFRQQAYPEYLLELAQLRPVIDAFFDRVLVMAPEEPIRKNRLALLFQLTNLFNRFALFSKYSL
jgi:glycyl-tRNA synthetase beta chain